MIGFREGLYDKLLALFIIGRIRGEKKFSGADALVGQIEEDIEVCGAKCVKYIEEKSAELGNFAAVL